LYGDATTESMRQAIAETTRRRKIQANFNERHGIVPTSIKKNIPLLDYAQPYVEPEQLALVAESPTDYGKDEAIEQLIHRLESEMKAAAKELEFERAAALRNRIRALKLRELELKSES
jgi:excinuclease ABC subunit B